MIGSGRGDGQTQEVRERKVNWWKLREADREERKAWDVAGGGRSRGREIEQGRFFILEKKKREGRDADTGR